MVIAMRRLYRRLSSLKQDKSDKFDHMENIAKFIVLVDSYKRRNLISKTEYDEIRYLLSNI